jgi:hypothetical protein
MVCCCCFIEPPRFRVRISSGSSLSGVFLKAKGSIILKMFWGRASAQSRMHPNGHPYRRAWLRSADFQVGCIADFQIRKPGKIRPRVSKRRRCGLLPEIAPTELGRRWLGPVYKQLAPNGARDPARSNRRQPRSRPRLLCPSAFEHHEDEAPFRVRPSGPVCL